MRLIDADELGKAKNLPEAIERTARGTSKDTLAAYMMGWNDALDAAAENAPTVEQRPHGKWIYTFFEDDEYPKCSVCGEIQETKSNFCPDCGAQMNGGEDHD